ncbi:MAG: tyrosine-type recombinase/integrase [Marmoricola sp.]
MAVVKREQKHKVAGRAVFSYQVRWRYLGDGPLNQSRTVNNLRDANMLNAALKDSGWGYKDTDPEVVHLTLIGAAPPVLPTDDEITVGEAIAEWVARPGLAPGSVKGYQTAAKRLAVLRDIPVSAVTKKDVNAALKAVEKTGVSASYMLTMRIVLNGALTAAGRPGMTADTHYTGGRKVNPHYLRPEQEEALIEAARAQCGDRLAAAVTLTLDCGLRWGETYGLRARFIDTEDGLLHVEQGINVSHKVEDGFKPSQLKTKTSRRKVPIPPELCTVLAPLLEGLDPNAPAFFPEPRGAEFWCHRTFHHQWKKICKAAEGVPNDLRYHDLRHTCAKRWLEAGVPIGIVSRMLGHSKIDVTHQEYGGFDTHSIELMRNLVAIGTAQANGETLKSVD